MTGRVNGRHRPGLASSFDMEGLDRIEDKLDRLADSHGIITNTLTRLAGKVEDIEENLDRVNEENRKRGERVGAIQSMVDRLEERMIYTQKSFEEAMKLRDDRIDRLNQIIMRGGGTLLLSIAGAYVMGWLKGGP